MEKDDKLEVFRPGEGAGGGLPLAESNIQAGFPSPADDFLQNRLDLNEHLVLHPAATYFVRVAGDSTLGAVCRPVHPLRSPPLHGDGPGDLQLLPLDKNVGGFTSR